jgi:hypothetical protein
MVGLLLCASASGANEASPDKRCPSRGMEVDGYQQRAGVALEAELRKGTIAQSNKMQTIRKAAGKTSTGEGVIKGGEYMEICFKASSNGFVTVWDTDADGYVSLLYPNVFSPAGKNGLAEKVTGGENVCLGTSKFKLKARPPYGASHVYVHWTPTLEGQLKPSDFPFVREQKANKRTLGLLASGSLQAQAKKQGCTRGLEIEEMGKEASSSSSASNSSTTSSAPKPFNDSRYASLTVPYDTQE